MPRPPQDILRDALALHQAGEAARARDLYLSLLDSELFDAELVRLLGTAECQLGNLEMGVTLLRRTLDMNPAQPGALVNLGNALHGLKRHAEALKSFDEALSLRPHFADAWYGRGFVLFDLARFGDAAGSFDRAARLKPDFADAWLNKGVSLLELKQYDGAAASFETVLVLKPDAPWLMGRLLHARMQLAQWDGFDEAAARLARNVAAGAPAAVPFDMQSVLDAPALQLKITTAYMAATFPACEAEIAPAVHDRIRVAYVSSDFGDHPVSHLMAGVLEAHDRDRFEIFAFSFGVTKVGPWRSRITAAADHFIDLAGLTDEQAIARIRGQGIDIAVDLNGLTKGNRTAVFAARVAPLQLSYIGYLGTMGAPYYDYLVADEVLIPPGDEAAYAEKIIRLPWYQSNDRLQAAPTRKTRRTDEGLPEDGFVFCAFNQTYKIAPPVYRVWLRIMAHVPGSVLWLFIENEIAMANLVAAAEADGIGRGRIVFARRLPLADHLARLALADLCLDTFPYNGGATTSNALRACVPVVTLRGRSFQARMGASLLKAAGHPHLVTETLDAYEGLATDLALTPDRLRDCRDRLSSGLASSPLFDTARSTRALEAAFTAAVDRHRRGLPPDHIHV